MANSKFGDAGLNDSLELARRSKSLIPQIKHWCSHIKVDSEYGGLIGQMGLPTMNYISCPQANGGGAMNLEWVATDFITGNCQDCQFHTETFPKNFGRITLERHKEHTDKLRQSREEEQGIIDEVRKKIKATISERFRFSKTTEISILRLVDKLSERGDQLQVARSIKESSRLKPAFFGTLSLDYLVLFFNNEDISPEIAEALVNVVLNDPSKLSGFTKSRIMDSFAKGQNLDIIVRLAPYLNLSEKEESVFVKLLISNYFQESFVRQDDPFENFSPYIIKYFQDYSFRQQENFKKVICSSLKDANSSFRKNTCLILYQLYVIDKAIAMPFLENMILAYNIEEDDRDGSDWTICRTLVRFCYTDTDLVLNTISNKFSALTPGAKVQILKFYDKFLETDDLRESFPSQSNMLIDKIIGFASNNEMEDDFETPLSVLRDLSRSYPAKFKGKFDVFIGFLITALKEKRSFDWNKENLDLNTTTFNPLIGLNGYDIFGMETEISTKLSTIRTIIVNLVQENESANFAAIVKIVRNLDSRKAEQAEVKNYLISIIRSSIKSNISLVQILPDIYNWLLDINAVIIRTEALKLVAILLRNHFTIIPQNIIDLLLLFVRDDDIAIRKFAIDACGEILTSKPSLVSEEIADYLLDQYNSRYIGIGRAMSGLTYPLLEMLPEEKHRRLYGKVVMMLHSHSMQEDKDHDFCQKLLRQALYLNRKTNSGNHLRYERSIVESYLLPDCSNPNFHIAEKAIELLRELRRNNPDLNDLWLSSVLAIIYKYRPHRHEMAVSNSFRKEFYSEMYFLRRSDLAKESESMIGYLKTHLSDVDLYDFDIINILNIFGYYSLHNENLKLCSYIIEDVQKVPSNKYLFRVIGHHQFLAGLAAAGSENDLNEFLARHKD